MMKEHNEREAEFLKKLKFRRQFLLGPHEYMPNKYWHVQELNNDVFLSVHKDLSFFSMKKNEYRITLLGIAIDCTRPYTKVDQIVTTLLDHFDDIHSVIKASKPLAGRWVLICQDSDNTFIFTDPCGFRQVYYTTGTSKWCASQPTLINQVKDLVMSSNTSLLKLRDSKIFKERESAWIGNKTVYDNCLHLMPNHYLNLNRCSQVRFFPISPIRTTDNVDKMVAEAATHLKNIMRGLEQKFNLKCGLSAGYDCRILLASAVDIVDKVAFFTDDLGKYKSHHADIYVPTNLAKKLKLNHNILLSTIKIIPDWFIKILSKNVLEARTSPILAKVKSIYNELINENLDSISLNGNVTEIVRVSGTKLNYELLNIDELNADKVKFIVNFVGYDNKYVESEINSWINSFDMSLLEEANLIDMFYWEQRMGNWGALYSAEFDISGENISPFNCRLLIETCLKVPRKRRTIPEFTFFKKIMITSWRNVLSEPFNPGPKGFGLLKKYLREKLPSSLTKSLRKIISS